MHGIIYIYIYTLWYVYMYVKPSQEHKVSRNHHLKGWKTKHIWNHQPSNHGHSTLHSIRSAFWGAQTLNNTRQCWRRNNNLNRNTWKQTRCTWTPTYIYIDIRIYGHIRDRSLPHTSIYLYKCFIHVDHRWSMLITIRSTTDLWVVVGRSNSTFHSAPDKNHPVPGLGGEDRFLCDKKNWEHVATHQNIQCM